MLDSLINNPITFVLWGLALMVAITVHEFAHAYAAEHLGDPTPRLLGRLTLNPLKHLDPIGTIFLLLTHFGWGKPVPFDPFNLRNPRRDSAIISVAGPLSNFIVAILASILLAIAVAVTPAPYILQLILMPIIVMNVSLGFFNLIPIHPLDGFKIVEGILPPDAARQWAQLESLGYIMLLVLVFPLFGASPILRVLTLIINAVINLLLPTIHTV